jgi:hypothetical protein
MNRNQTQNNYSLVQCQRCGRTFWARLVTSVYAGNSEKILSTNYRSCFHCGNQGYIEGFPVKILDTNGEVTAIVSPTNYFLAAYEGYGSPIGFSVMILSEGNNEIPYYSNFIECDDAFEHESKNVRKGDVIPISKKL